MRRDRQKKHTTSPLQLAVEHVLAGATVDRLLAVEASVRPAFEAFPKNSVGHIPMEEIFPAIVRNYFAKEHGWLIKGLEPPTLTRNVTRVSTVSIIADQAPALAVALEDLYKSEKGLSLSDVVGTIAALENLIVEESAALLDDCYFLNGAKTDDIIGEETLHEVLRSFLLIFRWGAPANLTDVQGHKTIKAAAAKASDWGPLVRFETGIVQAWVQESGVRSFSQALVLEIVREILQKYGKWQNNECVDMKGTLLGLAEQPGSGLVPWPRFHEEPNHETYQFTESLEYLQQIGVLQEGETANTSSIRIANYLLGPTNCIAPSSHYTVCCLSECESVISEVEARIQSPVAGTEEIVTAVEATASSTVEAGRRLPETAVEDLRGVASHYEGLVPLHSAEFKKWLYEAFPNECPFPTASEQEAEESELKVASEWLEHQQECTRIPAWHPASPPSEPVLEI